MTMVHFFPGSRNVDPQSKHRARLGYVFPPWTLAPVTEKVDKNREISTMLRLRRVQKVRARGESAGSKPTVYTVVGHDSDRGH